MKKTKRLKRVSVILLIFLAVILVKESLFEQQNSKSSLMTETKTVDLFQVKFVKTNQILYDIIDKYRIISMLDLSCDIQITSLLKNLSIEFNRKFSYHGVCYNDTLVQILQSQYESERKFSKIDIPKESLPIGYELIFLDYTSKNQTIFDLVNMLYSFAYTKNSVYLLISSRIPNEPFQIYSILNENGNILNLDLTRTPFNLTNFVQKYENDIDEKKYLLLYELSEMKKINFKKIKTESELLINEAKEKSSTLLNELTKQN